MVEISFQELRSLFFILIMAVFEDCKPFVHRILYSVHFQLYRFFKVWW